MTAQIKHLVLTLANLLQAKKELCTTAESCTGGQLSALLTELPGTSAWFDCGFITYSNHAKTKMLGVDVTLIEQYGAVSEEVVIAMAKGALDRSRASHSVAITGIAGPSGGSETKPVGLIWIAWANSTICKASNFHFSGSRIEIRKAAIVEALKGLITILKNQ